MLKTNCWGKYLDLAGCDLVLLVHSRDRRGFCEHGYETCFHKRQGISWL